MLGRAEGEHPRVGLPRPLAPRRRAIDHQHVIDPLAAQAEGGGEAALAGADDQHVEHMLARRAGARLDPGQDRVVEQREIGAHPFRQRGEACGRVGQVRRVQPRTGIDQRQRGARGRVWPWGHRSDIGLVIPHPTVEARPTPWRRSC